MGVARAEAGTGRASSRGAPQPDGAGAPPVVGESLHGHDLPAASRLAVDLGSPPGSGLQMVVNVILLAAGCLVVAVLIQVQTQLLHGTHLPWHVLLGTASGQLTPARWLPTLGAPRRLDPAGPGGVEPASSRLSRVVPLQTAGSVGGDDGFRQNPAQ